MFWKHKRCFLWDVTGKTLGLVKVSAVEAYEVDMGTGYDREDLPSQGIWSSGPCVGQGQPDELGAITDSVQNGNCSLHQETPVHKMPDF